MLSHDGKELSPSKLQCLRVYQRTLVIPPEWRGHTPMDTLFVQCDDCSNVKPIFQFYQNPNCQLGVYTVCIDCSLSQRRDKGQAKEVSSVEGDALGTKRCTGCEETKPITEFYRNINSKDAHQQVCRSCAAAHNADYISRLMNHPDREMNVAAQRRKQTLRVCIENGLPIPDVDDNADVKQCSRCQYVRSIDEFYANNRALDQKASWCIYCSKGRQQGSHEEVANVRYQQTLRLLAPLGLSHPGHDIKECRRCEFIKPLEDFGNNRRNMDGKEYYCRDCRRAYQRKARIASRQREGTQA